MIEVWILGVLMRGDLITTPFTTEQECRAAIGGLAIELVIEADCHPIEMLVPGGKGAPELSPAPPRKPIRGRGA